MLRLCVFERGFFWGVYLFVCFMVRILPGT